MQRVGRVDRRGATLDVVHVRVLVDDDQRALELTHVLRVDAEVGLEGHLDRDSRRHVDERPARPDGRVERGELVVVLRDDRREVLLHKLLVLTEAGVHVEEDHALAREVLVELVVDDLRLVLRPDAREVLLLRLGDAEPVPRVEDLRGEVLPLVGLLLRGPDVVVDVVEVDPGEICAPRRHRPRKEVVERLVPELAHPRGLVLVLRDRFDDLVREATSRLEEVVLGLVGIREPVLVVGADVADDVGLTHAHHESPRTADRRARAAYRTVKTITIVLYFPDVDTI